MDDKNADAYDGFDARSVFANRRNRKFHSLSLSITIEYVVEGVEFNKASDLLNGFGRWE